MTDNVIRDIDFSQDPEFERICAQIALRMDQIKELIDQPDFKTNRHFQRRFLELMHENEAWIGAVNALLDSRERKT